MIANIDPLAGRRFVAPNSHNVGRISKLADGAMHVDWICRPTAQDICEFVTWAQAVLGVPLDPYHVRNEGDVDPDEELRLWQAEEATDGKAN